MPLLSPAPASEIVDSCLMSDTDPALWAAVVILPTPTKVRAPRVRIMATTTKTSMRVNPPLLRTGFFAFMGFQLSGTLSSGLSNPRTLSLRSRLRIPSSNLTKNAIASTYSLFLPKNFFPVCHSAPRSRPLTNADWFTNAPRHARGIAYETT